MPNGKWSDDAFLDALRRQGDPQADETIARLIADGGAQAVGPIFRMLQANDTPLPADAPAPLKDFMAASAGLPPDIDRARLTGGCAVFLRHAMPSVVVLLASSLPRGYAAPCLSEILSISRDLQRHPFARLMGVVQLSSTSPTQTRSNRTGGRSSRRRSCACCMRVSDRSPASTGRTTRTSSERPSITKTCWPPSWPFPIC